MITREEEGQAEICERVEDAVASIRKERSFLTGSENAEQATQSHI